jgi:hypothetical protein
MWCKWAIQRGHSIEATAEKLFEVSAKAQERRRLRGDRGYTLLTARNAARPSCVTVSAGHWSNRRHAPELPDRG